MQKQILIFMSILSCSLFQASDIFKAIETNNKKAIQSWLKNNPDVNLLNEQGQTFLMKAVQAGNKKFVKQLLKRNVSVNIIDQFGKTALDYAVELKKDKIVIALAKKKAVVNNQENVQKVFQIKKHHRKMAIIKGVAISLGVYVSLILGGVVLLKSGCMILM